MPDKILVAHGANPLDTSEPALKVINVAPGGPAVQVRQEGAGNAIEVLGPNGTPIWSVTAAGATSGALATNPVYVDVEVQYGVDGTGVIDATAGIQQAINDAQDGATIYLRRLYKISSSLNMYGSDPANPKTIHIQGAGFYDGLGLRLTAGFTGPAINIAPTAAGQRTGYQVRDLYIDQTLANTTAEGIYLDKVQQTSLSDVKIRGGKTGVKVGFANINRFNRVICFNQSDAGMRWITQYGDLSTVPEAIDHKLFQCLVYQTSGATTDMNAFYEFQSGNDFEMALCHGLRAVGTSRKVLDGLLVNFAAPKNAYIFMTNCEFDGITDLTVGGTTHGAARFVNAVNVHITNSWFSCTDGVNYQPGVLIDGGDVIEISGSWISGNGLWWTTAANTRTKIYGCTFPNAYGTDAFNFPASGGPTAFWQSMTRYEAGILGDGAKIVAAMSGTTTFPRLESPHTILTDDQDSFHAFRLQNASTGFGKSFRVNRGTVGKTLEILADNGSTKLMTLSDSGQPVFPAGSVVTGLATGSGVTITPSAAQGNWHTQTISTTAAIAVNAPTGPPAVSQTQTLTIEVSNTSGGVLGAFTWNAIYVPNPPTFTAPATGKKRWITFQWNGVAWVYMGQAPADY